MIGGRATAAGTLGALGTLGTLAMIAALAGGCLGPGDFRCSDHAQCTLGPTQGTCEANGHCSVPDDRCQPSLRRYVHSAGDDADRCVPPPCGDDPMKAVKTVSAGGGHACLLRNDNSLWCWGRNDRGQLGDGSRTPRPLPVHIAALGDVRAIATGDAHTCATTGTGDVFCWGAGDLGQLGSGDRDDHGLPQPVLDVRNVSALAAGSNFSCALGADGSVRCWGDDSVGQLGDGGPAGSPAPVVVAGLGADIQALVAEGQHACALTALGLLTCWGANGDGQIGDGTTGGARPPTLVNDPSATTMRLPTFSSVGVGGAHTCAVAADGLYCWGDNTQGQVDRASPGGAVPWPIPVPGNDAIDPVKVTAGAQHTCVLRSSASVGCWGADDSDQLGGGTPIGNAADVVAGAAFTCALGRDGAVFCWGDNRYGQLASGGDTVRVAPAPVPGLAHVGALAAGGAHNCATADDADGARALLCWGANGSGQLGNGSLADAPAATRISALQPIGIAAGSAHTCAFTAADKQLRCWGWGAAGQLGLNPGFDMVVTTPTEVDLSPPEGGDGVFAVVAGAAHTCVGAMISKSVLCFGLDADGQLGDKRQAQGGPGPVGSFMGRPKAMAAGDAHTCAIDADGVIWCWGRNSEGQLGDGTTDERSTPTVVSPGQGGVPADAITAGAAHTCALAGGRVSCWGRNAEGQLGTTVPAPQMTPQLVTGLPQARAVAAGGHHTCAIGDDATVWCWGANESGQLGDGDTKSTIFPVRLPGLTGVDAIVAGSAHSCAHRSDGTVWCWGANTSGQLGDRATLTSARPLLARVACE